ncbi:sensor histidine kinase [Vibrio sp. MA40-2]|uniref:sensor histidine kinase n=1 Tax=Vibrio sp. MA40-2 TaxID=3391828 RepID=UPI0039A412F6
MRLSIRYKLMGTYLLISVITALTIYLLTYYTSEQRVAKLTLEYQVTEMVREIRRWYATEESWDGFEIYFKALHPPKNTNHNQDNVRTQPTKKAGIVTAQGTALLEYKSFQIGDVIPQAFLARAQAVKYNGDIIAWVIPPEATGINLNSQLQVFLDNILDVLLISIAISIVVSLVMGGIIANFALRPIDSLINASSAIASGNLNQKVNSYPNDEIGDLADSFNQMSNELAISDQRRKQLTADITHDLGTPVQVISGYIEMAQDGAMALNPGRLNTITSELDHIQRLVKDLSTLAQSDAKALSFYPEMSSITELVDKVVQAHQVSCKDKGIHLIASCQDPLPNIEIDPERMTQVLGNLINNATRYVSTGGQIEVLAYTEQTELVIEVIDTGCGISNESLPFIFDRFYRANASRSSKSGKMGLGLSICKALIEMHQGKIRVESDGQSYSRFIIRLPR